MSEENQLRDGAENETDSQVDVTYRVINLLFANWTIGPFNFAKNMLVLHTESELDEFGTLLAVMPDYIRGNVVVTREGNGNPPVHVQMAEIANRRRKESADAAGASGVRIVTAALTKGAADVIPSSLLAPINQLSTTIRGAATAADSGVIDKPKV